MVDEMIVDLIIKWAVPVICTGIVGACSWAYKRSAKQVSAVGNGVQALLRAEIIRSHKEYTHKGYCPVYAKEALERTYQAYHELGGNDVATGLYREILDLPTEKREDNE